MPNSPIIEESDLNIIDFQNGTGHIDKHPDTVNLNGVMNGAFMHETGFRGNGKVEIPMPRANFSYQNINETISNGINDDPIALVGNIISQPYVEMWVQIEQYTNVLIENFEWKGLPDELDKYKLEQKIIKNGSVAIIKEMGLYLAVGYKVIENDIYNNPIKISVLEPNFNKNGKEYSSKNFAIIRHNPSKSGLILQIMRILLDWEKTLYQLEKNITSANDTCLVKNVDSSVDGENSLADTLENAKNSERTFFEVSNTPFEGKKVSDLIDKIDIKDRSSELIAIMNFFKENIKEKCGIDINMQGGKKERTITSEIGTQQGLSDRLLKSMLNIRKNDLIILNKKFNENWDVNLIEYEQEQDNQELEESQKKGLDTNVI